MLILGFKTKNHKQSNLRVTTITCTSTNRFNILLLSILSEPSEKSHMKSGPSNMVLIFNI